MCRRREDLRATPGSGHRANTYPSLARTSPTGAVRSRLRRAKTSSVLLAEALSPWRPSLVRDRNVPTQIAGGAIPYPVRESTWPTCLAKARRSGTRSAARRHPCPRRFCGRSPRCASRRAACAGTRGSRPVRCSSVTWAVIELDSPSSRATWVKRSTQASQATQNSPIWRRIYFTTWYMEESTLERRNAAHGAEHQARPGPPDQAANVCNRPPWLKQLGSLVHARTRRPGRVRSSIRVHPHGRHRTTLPVAFDDMFL